MSSCTVSPARSTAELWYAGGAVCGFTGEQLRVSAKSRPEIETSASPLKALSDVALDANGDVWVVGQGSDHLFRFPNAAFGTAEAEPDLVVQSAALKNPGNLTFDDEGGLWVANRAPQGDDSGSDGSIVRFDIPHGLTGKHNLAPVARITSSTEGDLFQIGYIAFDTAQNLWVTSFAGLLRFDDPRSHSGDVVLEPGAVLAKDGFEDNIYFYSVAFDRYGDLWAASGDGLHYLTSVTKFEDPGSLRGRSSPAAAAVISGAEDLIPAGGIAFDGAGNLWLATGESILMYSNPHALMGKVNPRSAVTLEVFGRAAPSTNTHLVFFPTPTPSIEHRAKAQASAPRPSQEVTS